MLESVLADVLTRVLGQYLEGIDRDSVRFGAWSGLVELRGVALRPEALAVFFETLGLDLPVTVEAGFIGLLRLQVPWNAIGTTPVQIHMEEITIMARPVRGDGSDDSELQTRERRIKRAKLDTDDAVREASWGVAADTSSSWSNWLVSEDLRAKIINNIQIHLSGILLRFEDPFSDPRRPYIASIVCESLRAVSASADWREAFVERPGDSPNATTRKLLEIKGFRVNWAPITPRDAPGLSRGTSTSGATSSTRFETPELLKQFMTAGGITHASGDTAESTIKSLLQPVDGSMRLSLSARTASSSPTRDATQQDPSVDLDIRFPEVDIDLDDVQYACLLQTSVYFAKLSTRGFRPETPRERWVWAIDQLLPGFSSRRERALRFTEKGICEARDRRILYIAYRKSVLKARRMSVEEPSHIARDLEKLEDSISYEEVLALRDAVDRQVELEGEDWKPVHSKAENPKGAQSSGTTISSFWQMLGYEEGQEILQSSSVVQSRTEIAPKTRESLSPTPSTRTKIDSSNLIALRVSFYLRGTTIRLSENGFPNTSIRRLSLNLSGLRCGFLLTARGDLTAEAVLGSIEAWDLVNEVKMVYSRSNPSSESLREGGADQCSYPIDVARAIDSIRNGLNVAEELLVEDSNSSDIDDGDLLGSDLDLLTSEKHPVSITSRRQARLTRQDREASATSIYVTEEELFGGSISDFAGSAEYVAAFRYICATPSEGNMTVVERSTLDVSVATLEAIIDGPEGSFVWGLKFWQPKGMAQDPIMAFLGAAAGARIAELRMEVQEALLAKKVPMQINAVIQAPRFILPSSSKSSAAIIVNMGTLGICTSDSTRQDQYSSADRAKGRLRYSSYVLTLDDLGVYLSPNLSTAISQAGMAPSVGMLDNFFGFSTTPPVSPDTAMVERIIRPFSLRFMLQTLRDSNVIQVANAPSGPNDAEGTNIAKVKVRGNIPGLYIIVTQKAFEHLLVEGRRWTVTHPQPPNLSKTDFSDSSGKGWQPTRGGINEDQRFRRNSGNFVSYEEDLQRQLSASEPTVTASMASYDVNVTMKKVSIEIRESMESRLVTALASEMVANIVKTGRSQLRADFSLQSWSVTDGSRGSTAAFRKLVYAGTFFGSTGISPPRTPAGSPTSFSNSSREDSNFVTFRYTLDLLANEQNIYFKFLSLNMVCVRETYVKLASFFYKTLQNVKEAAKNMRDLEESKNETMSLVSTGPDQSSTATVSDETSLLFGKTSLVSEFDGFSLQLIASGGTVALVEMKDSKIELSRNVQGDTKGWGDFRYFCVRDCTAPISEHALVLTYEQEEPTVAGPAQDSRRDKWTLEIPSSKDEQVRFAATFKGIDVCFLYRFLIIIQQYFSVLQDGIQPALDVLMEQVSDAAADDQKIVTSARGSTFIDVDIELTDLNIRAPRHSGCSSEALTINISKMHLTNGMTVSDAVLWDTEFETITFATEYVLPKVLDLSETPGRVMSAPFWKQPSAKMMAHFGDSNRKNGAAFSVGKAWLVNVQFSHPVLFELCEAQYTVLYFVLTENLEETIDGSEVCTDIKLDESLSSTGFDRKEGHSLHTQELISEVNRTSTLQETVVPQGNLRNDRRLVLDVDVHIPILSLEFSRGWDVTESSCKVVGLYMGNAKLDFTYSTPSHMFGEISGNVLSITDLRTEGASDGTFAAPIVTLPRTLDSKERSENVTLTYEKETGSKALLVVFLAGMHLEIVPELCRDLTCLAIPGWPYLTTSAPAPDYVYLGRSMTVVLGSSQVLLRAEEDDEDNRALLFTGEFHVKVDWMKGTGAKRVYLQSTQLEISTIYTVPPLARYPGSNYQQEYGAMHFNKMGTPLFYPTDSFIEYVDPDVDEAGCRLHISADSILCLVNTSEIPLLKAVAGRPLRLKSSYLIRREWVQVQLLSTGDGDDARVPDPKQERIRKARQNLNVSIHVSAARYLITDVGGGRFVPILEARLKSFDLRAHLGNMIQVEGELAMDLFNTRKGWWEPAVEPWSLSASMSNGQSGARAIVVKSEQRLNINITPMTVTAATTVAKALKNATTASSYHENDDSLVLNVGQERDSVSVDSLKSPSRARRPTVAAFLVRNELGVPIAMNRRRSSRRTTIDHNSEVEVGVQTEDLVSISDKDKTKAREEALKCILVIPGMVPRELSANDVGKQNIQLMPAGNTYSHVAGKTIDDDDLNPLHVVWEVEMISGVPVCTIRSLVRLVNETSMDLEVRVKAESRHTAEGNHMQMEQNETVLQPGSKFSVPVYCTEMSIQVRPRAGNLFQWSNALPSLSSLYHHSSTDGIKTPFVRCKTSQIGSSDFFISLSPRCPLETYSTNAESSTWIDVVLRAPLSLRNSLPKPLSYRITYRSASSNANSQSSFISDGFVLAAGVIPPQQLSHLHFSSENLNFVFLSLAYENLVVECANAESSNSVRRALGSETPSRFGPEVSFDAMQQRKVAAVLPSAQRTIDSKGHTRRDFRATIMPTTKGLPHYEVFSGFWIRNRSDTTVEVCSRGSYYGAGSQLFRLKENPPSEHPFSHVCLEGPYLSIRLPKSSSSDSNINTLDHSEWWTSPSVLEDIGKPIAVHLRGKSLEVDVRPALGLESRTFIITVRNLSWICNNTTSVLQWCNSTSLDAHGNCVRRLLRTLRPMETSAIHWDVKASQKAVHLRIADDGGESDWIWSPAIPLNIGHSRELPAKMYRPKSREQYIARVASKELEGNSRALVLYEEDRQNPPYRIVNLCQKRAIGFSQIGSLERPWLVRAGMTTRYSWDNPLASPSNRMLSILVVEPDDTGMKKRDEGTSHSSNQQSSLRRKTNLNIDVVGDRVLVLSESYNPSLVVSVSVDGATKIVTFCDEDKDGNLLVSDPDQQHPFAPGAETREESVPTVGWDEIRQDQEISSTQSQNGETSPFISCDYPAVSVLAPRQPRRLRKRIDTDTAIFLDSIGVSLVTEDPLELLYLSLKGVLVNYEAYSSLECFSLHVKAFQVDNQLLKTPYPVLLWPSNPESLSPSDAQKGDNAITLEVQRTITKDDILMIKSFKALIRPLNICFEDDFISKALRFLGDTSLVSDGAGLESLSGADSDQLTFRSKLPGFESGAPHSPGQEHLPTSRRIYVHDFKILSTSLRLTSKGSGAAVAKAAGINSSARALVALVLNVENCQFLFPSLNVQNVFDSLHHFAILVREYYVTQLSNQRMKLLASNALVGNPAALFDAVGTGARDFFAEPGRAKGSADFIASVGRGSKSLFTHTVGGLVDSVSSIPRAVSSGLEKAVGDNEYLAERERIRGSNLPGGHRGSSAKNPAQGLATGALSFAHGISSGVTGFIREPVQGARQGGAGGLLKGIGKAFIGGVAKPVAGVIDLVAEPAAGLSQQIAEVDRSGRKNAEEIATPERPPRSFRGRNQRLGAYDRRMSVGEYLYRTSQFASGTSFNSELVNWIELSDRPGRVGTDSEIWVWNVVQDYTRRMPGRRRSTRANSRSRSQANTHSLLDSRPEKIRVALVTMTDILIASLDCKLVTAIPLWGDCIYDVAPQGKEVLLRTTVKSEDETDVYHDVSGLSEGYSLISAPWDPSVIGRRRKPAPGQYTVDRIPSGSMEARNDLVASLRYVTNRIQKQSDQDSQAAGSSADFSSSAIELIPICKAQEANWQEMKTTGKESITSTVPSAGTHTEKRVLVDSSSKNANSGFNESALSNLEKRIKAFSSDGIPPRPGREWVEKLIIANAIENDTLCLTEKKIERGSFMTNPVPQIDAFGVQAFEMLCRISASGRITFSIGKGENSTGMGNEREIVLDFFDSGQSGLSFSASTPTGFHAEVEKSPDSDMITICRIKPVDRDGTAEGRREDHGQASRHRPSEEVNVGGNRDLSADELSLQQLMDIGFKFEDAVVALSEAKGDLVKAVDILTSK